MKRVLAYVVDKLDELGHWLGWTPRWLCDLNEALITGEPQ